MRRVPKWVEQFVCAGKSASVGSLFGATDMEDPSNNCKECAKVDVEDMLTMLQQQLRGIAV